MTNQLKSSTLFLSTVLALVSLLVVSPMSPVFGQEHGQEGEHAHEEQGHGHGQENVSESGNEPYDIHFQTHPEQEKIIPDKDMVELMFNVTHNGEPAKDVELSYRVYTPEKAFWFGTDFPVVEGTQLLSGSVPLPSGNQMIAMILPIRGVYKVKTTVRGPEGTTTKTFNFSVSENPQEKVNLGIFLLALFFIGGLGGFIFSKTSPDSTPGGWLIGPVLIGSLLVGLSNPGTVMAHGEGSWDPHSLEENVGANPLRNDVHLETEVFPQPVDVGEMLNVRYHAEVQEDEKHHEEESHGHTEEGHEDHGLNGRIMAESHFVHSEGGLEMVKQSSWLSKGTGNVSVQLFDGAPHYLVTRFYKATDVYKPSGGHEHGQEGGHDEKETTEKAHKKNGDKEEDHSKGHMDENEHGHEEDHGSEEEHHSVKPSWEAESAYHLDAGQFTVRFHESGDPAMKWLLLPEDTDDLREQAKHGMETCESIDAGASIPGDSACYNLTLNEDGTTFTLDVKQSGHYRLFTQHLPREFDMTIETDDGSVIEPDRKFVTGKGEYLGRTVKSIKLNPVQPPLDDIIKSMITLLGMVGLGVVAGFKGPGLIG